MNSLILGRNIYKARRDRGYTSDALSALCDVTPAYLRQVEAGSKTPSLPFFVTLCDQLKVSPSILLSGVVDTAVDSSIEELVELCKTAKPSELRLITALVKAALDTCQ